MTSLAKLSDAQVAILIDAVQREDLCILPPKTLKGGALQKVAAKLLREGFVREVKSRTGMPIWRRDDEAGQSYSLKLTATGIKAVSADDTNSRPAGAVNASSKISGGSLKSKNAPAANELENPTSNAPSTSAPRDGSKIAHVITLLQRDQGARLDELIAATGWMPHTARAALTGLRRRGYDVRLERGEKGQASVYRASAALAMAS